MMGLLTGALLLLCGCYELGDPDLAHRCYHDIDIDIFPWRWHFYMYMIAEHILILEVILPAEHICMYIYIYWGDTQKLGF